MTATKIDDFLERASRVPDLTAEERAKLEGTRLDPNWWAIHERAAAYSMRGTAVLLLALLGVLMAAVYAILGWACGIR